jgi:hypothetical protein
LLKARKPETVVLVVLLADAAIALTVAILYGFPTLILLGLIAGLCSSLGKLSLDAMIQRDVPETVRTSVFARSETVLQLSWVIGGGCGIVLPLIPRLGFGFLAAVLLVVIVLVVRHKPAAQPRTASGPPPGPRTPAPHQESRPVRRADVDEPRADREGTTRTVMTSEPPTTRISERRAQGPRTADPHTSEPTVELRIKPVENQEPVGDRPTPGSPPAGRWWSGQPDDDDTLAAPATWAEEPTVERTAEQPAIERRTSRNADEPRPRRDPGASPERRPNGVRPDDDTRVERRTGLFRRRRSR